MNKTVAHIIMIISTAVCFILSLCCPWVLSDNNNFLKNFVNHEMLSFLGVVVTITLASAANLHLELNKFEEKVNENVFHKTRDSIKKSAYWLLSFLSLAIVLVIAKPLLCGSVIATSLINGAALLIILFNILTLVDLTNTVFALGPQIKK